MSDEIRLLRDTADRFLADHAPVARLRSAARDPDLPGFSRNLWREAAALGLTGLMAPEAMGGFALGTVAAGAILEVCGSRLAPEPFLSNLGLAVPVLAAARTRRADEILAGLVAGEVVAAVAAPTANEFGSGAFSLTARRMTGGWKIEGHAPMLPDAGQSDWLLLPAQGDAGPAWFAIPSADGPALQGVLMDGRRASRGPLRIEAGDDALLACGPQAQALTETMVSAGAALISAWLLGAAGRAHELALEHLRTRRQFGAPLGSFQALQHRMAIVHCELAVARATTEAALAAIDAGAADAALLASAAKARSAEAADRAASEAIQMFGALGLTDEADIGYYYKAIRIADLLAGHRYFHKGRAARALGLELTARPDPQIQKSPAGPTPEAEAL